MEKSPSRPNGFYEIRDELSKNPRRKHNKVEAYWLDEDQLKAKLDQDWWEKGQWDVVKEGGYWDNGKYIPTDIAGKVKEIVEREIKNMKGKMQRDEVSVLEQMKAIKDKTRETDKARIRALDELRKVKAKLHKQQVQEDMRQNYVYDVMFQRWKDRERKLEDEYKKFPARNSFPVELRRSEYRIRPVVREEGELPSDTKKISNTSVKVMDEMWP